MEALGYHPARLAQAASLEEIIAVVKSSARNVISADGVSFVLREYGDCHFVEENAIAPLWMGRKFPLTSYISGWAMLNAKTAVIPDVFAHDRIAHDLYRKTFVRSLVMAPVGFDAPIAAMGATWRDKPVIGVREVSAAKSIAGTVGQAMRRTSMVT